MATEQAQLRQPNVQATLNNLGQNRKMVLLGAGVVTIVLTLIIVFFAYSNSKSKGAAVELVKGIGQDRAFELVSKLKSSDIDADIVSGEIPGKVNVTVFEKDFDKAAIALSRSDLLQEDGFNLFDKNDWAASDYDKRIKMMRAVNGDLSRIVSRMSGVKWSTVRVNIPEPQLFTQYQAPTTATVQVELLEEGNKLTRTQVKSIINLLVGYVPNLQKNNISIIDTNGQSYSAVESEESDAGEILEETERVNKIIQKRIEEYLEPLIGYNNYIVRISSEINRKKVEESSTQFADGAVGQEQIGDEHIGSPAVVAATVDGGEQSVSNIDTSKGYTKTNRITQRYPSFKQKTVSTPPGKISKITVAIAINSSIPAGTSIKQLKEGIAAITSPDTTADDIKISIAEFVNTRGSIKAVHSKSSSQAIPGAVTNAFNSVKKLPRWAMIAIGIFGVLMFLTSLSGGRKPVTSIPQESTVSQINQSMQRQFQRPDMQIGASPTTPFDQQQIDQPVQTIRAKEPDLTNIISNLKQAADEKPEFLANKLQIWLEEGSTKR